MNSNEIMKQKCYVITCKDDYPPAHKYTITVYDAYYDLPYDIREHRKQNKIYHENKDTLMFWTRDTDPVGAMIQFWQQYMYHEVGND